MDLRNLTIKKFSDGLRKKEFSALEATKAYLAEIKKKNPAIHAYLSVSEDVAIKDAEAADALIASGETHGDLLGVPLALKDNMLIAGGPATAASKILEKYVSAYDATVVSKLKSQHAVFLGKTNLDEFAMGSSTENSAFGPTKNPHDLTRVAGGSSGGSAAAVASDMALAALGSDTGGSIRQPAAFCGVVGLKPTYGAVSRYGLIAMASSLDQIGPITKTVEDAAILFRAIAGHDPSDATSAEVTYNNELLTPDYGRIKNLTIGIPDEYFVEGLDNQVASAVQSVIKTLSDAGLHTKRIRLPHTKYALSVYYIIQPAEVSSNLARFDGIRYGTRVPDAENLIDLYRKDRSVGFGPEPKRRIILGTFVLSSGYYDAYYVKAQKVRALVSQDFDEAFKEVDVVLAPTTPTAAFRIGEKTADPLQMYLSDVFTIPANLAGLPAISIPIQGSKLKVKSLPIGFQLMGRPWREADILGLGQFYESLG